MLTQSEIDAIKQEAAKEYPEGTKLDMWTFKKDEHYQERRQAYLYAAKKYIELERQRAKALQTGLMAAIDVIKQWHGADDVWDIYFNNAPEMKPIREALNTYNKNKPNDRE